MERRNQSSCVGFREIADDNVGDKQAQSSLNELQFVDKVLFGAGFLVDTIPHLYSRLLTHPLKLIFEF